MKQEVEQDGIGDGTNCCFIICDVCELAPAAVTCKVDAAALCVACDRDIHSANPLAARHHRVPLNQFDHHATTTTTGSWIPGTNSFADQYHQERKSVDLFSLFEDQFVGLDSYQLISPSSQTYDGDGVVPVQITTLKPPPPRNTDRADLPENLFESTKFNTSNVDFSFLGNSCYGIPSLSHTVSSSSMDVGVVPDGSSLSDITNPFTKPGLSSSAISRHQGSQEVVTCTAADREARVLRYKEKRKNRKFEKTIRYASRKAYAESRPRIKGRFAKRSTDYSDVSTTTGMFSSHDACYGVVRSFPESTTTTCSISNFQYRGF